MSNLHVAHAVLFLDVGGLERVVLDLVRDGRTRGQRVSVLCIERPGTLAPAAAELGARVVCAGKPRGFRPDHIAELATLLRRVRPDVLHTHQIGALFYAGPAARRAGIPVVVHTEHGKQYASNWRRRLVGRLAGRYARRYFCVSADVAREVRDYRIVAPGKVAVVPNGIDVDRFARAEPADPGDGLGIQPGARVIGTVGRLTEIKRQDLLIRAFARVAARHPAARLLLVGDGPLRNALETLTTTLGVGDRVTFAGYRDRPERFLRLMDVFALTSRSEGMPLAILEAWASGLPVVASRVGGVPEVVADGRTGLLFPPGDEAALATHLERLLTDPVAARALGDAGRAEVREKFDVRTMCDTYQRYYRALLRARAGAGA
jgi:sugar transferase (PEP-CTERM/EpsH1 system associated)